MDSQLTRLHLHFALSQPMYERATLPLYFYDNNHKSYQLDNFTLMYEDWGNFFDDQISQRRYCG